MDLLKFEFWNSCNIDVFYQGGFKQSLFLDSDLIASEPFIEEDGSVNQNNEFKPTFQKYGNIYKVETMCPEFLIDALAAMQLCDNIWLYRKEGQSAKIKDLSIDVDWKFTDCYALVGLNFEVDYFAFNPCCDLEPCEDCTPTIVTTTQAGLNVLLRGDGCDGYVQVQEYVGGLWVDLGTPVSAGKFDATGVIVTPTTSPTTLRVHAYTNSCDYGYSEPTSFCLGLICEVSPPTGIKTISLKGTNLKQVVID